MTERLMPIRKFYGNAGQRMIPGLIAENLRPERLLVTGERYLGSFIVPTFQRRLVWSETQKARLIESIYLGLPIGSIVWNATQYTNPCDGWLLDGQQRMTAIIGYVAGHFSVQGWRFPDLPKSEKMHFWRMGISTIETQIDNEAECRDIYERLVFGGTPHAKATP
jgi:Protein of unknown function DUF262